MMHLAPFVILVIVAFLGTIGNLLIIGAVCIHRPLRTLGNAFVVNLAVADLIVTSYIMPMGLVASQFEDKPYSDTVCEVNGFLVMITLGVSTQTLMVVALERYFYVCQKRVYHKLFSRKLTAFYVVLIWCYTAIWTVQGYTGWSAYKYVSVVWVCMMDAEASLSFNICILVVGVVSPVSIQIFSYVSMFYKVHQSSKALRRSSLNGPGKGSQEYLTDNRHISQAEQRFLITLVTIVVVFLVCWTPTGLVMTLMGAGISSPLILYPIAVWLSFSNSSMNSVIYGIMNKNFRKGYRQILRKVACQKQSQLSDSSVEFFTPRCCNSYCSTRTRSDSQGNYNLDPEDQTDNQTSDNRIDPLCLSTIRISSPTTGRVSLTFEEIADEPLPETIV